MSLWGKIHVSTTTLKILMLVGQLLLGSGGWQDYQSLPTCTLHEQTLHPHVGRETTTHFYSSIVLLSSCIGGIFLLMHGMGISSSFSSHRELEKMFTVTHDFPMKEPFMIWVCCCSPHELWFAVGSFMLWLVLVSSRIWLLWVPLCFGVATELFWPR